jgi:predicted nucleic acid-binding protein
MAEVLVVSPYVLAELDYLITTRIGVAAELAMLRELTSPAYELAMVSAADLGTAADIVERHQELNIGLTDASLVARTVRGLRSRPYCQVDAG